MYQWKMCIYIVCTYRELLFPIIRWSRRTKCSKHLNFRTDVGMVVISIKTNVQRWIILCQRGKKGELATFSNQLFCGDGSNNFYKKFKTTIPLYIAKWIFNTGCSRYSYLQPSAEGSFDNNIEDHRNINNANESERKIT